MPVPRPPPKAIAARSTGAIGMADDLIRPIEEADVPAVCRLMAESFPRRDVGYFERGFERLAAAPEVPGCTRYGYVIDDGGLRGAALGIPSLHDYGHRRQPFVNISTWCVAPSHRGPLAKALYDRTGANAAAVNTNLSAAAHTIRTLEKLGFEPWTTGQFLALRARGPRPDSRVVAHDARGAPTLAAHHARVLDDHAGFGCLTPVIDAEDGPVPLVLLPRRVARAVPVAQVIYCERRADLGRHAGALLRWVRRRGRVGLLIDADDPIEGFAGRHYPGKAAKYLRGARPEYDVEHTYSEMVRLGF